MIVHISKILKSLQRRLTYFKIANINISNNQKIKKLSNQEF